MDWMLLLRVIQAIALITTVACIYLSAVWGRQSHLYTRAMREFGKSLNAFAREDYTRGDRYAQRGKALSRQAKALDRFVPPRLR